MLEISATAVECAVYLLAGIIVLVFVGSLGYDLALYKKEHLSSIKLEYLKRMCVTTGLLIGLCVTWIIYVLTTYL